MLFVAIWCLWLCWRKHERVNMCSSVSCIMYAWQCRFQYLPTQSHKSGFNKKPIPRITPQNALSDQARARIVGNTSRSGVIRFQSMDHWGLRQYNPEVTNRTIPIGNAGTDLCVANLHEGGNKAPAHINCHDAERERSTKQTKTNTHSRLRQWMTKSCAGSMMNEQDQWPTIIQSINHHIIWSVEDSLLRERLSSKHRFLCKGKSYCSRSPFTQQQHNSNNTEYKQQHRT